MSEIFLRKFFGSGKEAGCSGEYSRKWRVKRLAGKEMTRFRYCRRIDPFGQPVQRVDQGRPSRSGVAQSPAQTEVAEGRSQFNQAAFRLARQLQSAGELGGGFR